MTPEDKCQCVGVLSVSHPCLVIMLSFMLTIIYSSAKDIDNNNNFVPRLERTFAMSMSSRCRGCNSLGKRDTITPCGLLKIVRICESLLCLPLVVIIFFSRYDHLDHLSKLSTTFVPLMSFLLVCLEKMFSKTIDNSFIVCQSCYY